MPSFNVAVPHRLGQELALARVRNFAESVERDYADQVSQMQSVWNGNQLNFNFLASGKPISGVLTVEDSAVSVTGPLPFVAILFRGRIEQSIRDELTKLLNS
jgi:hypothetical protein